MKTFYVYITCSKKNGTLYIGMTNDLTRRMQEHKNKLIKGFTKKYSVNLLVYYETFESIIDAIKREKQLKKWKREWKMHFIEKINPNWKDLSETDIFLDPRIREDDNKENMNFTYSSATNTDNFNIGSLPNSSDIKIDQVPRHPRECGDPVFIAPNKEENE
ncbi:TPA: hypothetical protein DEO28_04165 [Candidatus Dependentiae bacterium]|nr:hypothetical protein [Candidatus Dependentiae bacterium]HBZ73678.1 hypothetical protein [Candidatus Dependentiae bacterium]